MTILNLQIAAGADDGYTREPDIFDSAAAIYYLGSLGEGAEIDAFCRFTGVTIPQGATITVATLTLTSEAALSSVTMRTNVAAEDADNPVAPTSYAIMTARVRTSTFVVWDFTTNWVLDGEYSPPDLAAVIQEVVNRGGWSSGNALIVFVDNDASTDTTHRRVHSYDGTPAKSAKLDITYHLAAVPMDHYRRRRT